jgi:hypothetical protein
MDEILKTAYALGGASGVVIMVLCAAVFYLYRAREREHRERLRETRESSVLMAKLLDTAAQRSVPPRPLPSASIPPPAEDWESDTVITRMREQQIRELVIRYIDEDE